MLPTVETDVVEIDGPREVRFERETLVLEGMGPREVGAETIYSAVSPGTELAAYEGLQVSAPRSGALESGGLLQPGPRDRLRRLRATALPTWRPDSDAGVASQSLRLRRRRDSPEAAGGRLHRRATAGRRHDLSVPPGLRGAARRRSQAGTIRRRSGTRDAGPGHRGRRQSFRGARVRTVGSAGVAPGRLSGRAPGRCSTRVSRRRRSRRSGRARPPPGSISWCSPAARGSDYRLAVEIARLGRHAFVSWASPGRREDDIPFNPLDPRWFYRKQLSIIACGYTPDVEIDPRDIRFTIRRNCAYLIELILAGELPASRARLGRRALASGGATCTSASRRAGTGLPYRRP